VIEALGAKGSIEHNQAHDSDGKYLLDGVFLMPAGTK
jgi:hypothetical protein